MKKKIILLSCIALIGVICILILGYTISECSDYHTFYEFFKGDPYQIESEIAYHRLFLIHLFAIFGLLIILAGIVSAFVYVLRSDSEERKKLLAEKREQQKQERIQKLQNQIDELKNDS